MTLLRRHIQHLHKQKLIFRLFIFLSLGTISLAEITLPRFFSDGMVLQRDQNIRIWGWSDHLHPIVVQLDDEQYTTKRISDNKWECYIAPNKAGINHTLTVFSEDSGDKLIIEDVCFGDIWFCSGQSNMELPLYRVQERYPNAIANSTNSNIRFFRAPKVYNFNNPQSDVPSGSWKKSNPTNSRTFSAIAYFFAKELEQKKGIPIGIINTAVGGSPIEAWLPRKTIENDPVSWKILQPYLEQSYIDKTLHNNQKIYSDWDKTLNAHDMGWNATEKWMKPNLKTDGWNTFHIPGEWKESGIGTMSGAVWFRKEVTIPEHWIGLPAKLYLGAIVDADTTYINGQKVGNTTYRYPPRIYPLEPTILKKGENNITIRAVSKRNNGEFVSGKTYQLKVGNEVLDLKGNWSYQIGCKIDPIKPTDFVQWKPIGLYNAVIAPFENFAIKGILWYQGESNTGLPYQYADQLEALIKDWRQQWNRSDLPFLFVQLANFMNASSIPEESNWAILRDQQRQALRIPHTAMTVAIDLGEWNDIHPLNKADIAKRLSLQARSLAYNEKLVHSGPLIKQVFAHDHQATVLFDTLNSRLIVSEGNELKGFEIAGSDRIFHAADAHIVENKVTVASPHVSNPTWVRYAWANNPDQANLYNEMGLPASPFEMEVMVPTP